MLTYEHVLVSHVGCVSSNLAHVTSLIHSLFSSPSDLLLSVNTMDKNGNNAKKKILS